MLRQPTRPRRLRTLQYRPSGREESRPGGVPLYVWVIAAVVLAIPLGLLWGEGAMSLEIMPRLIRAR